MTSEPEEMSTEEFIQRLLAPERAQRHDTFLILSMSGVNLQDTVADIGCGPGYFTVPLAKYLVNGKLYALDIDDEMLEACRNNVSEAHMGKALVYAWQGRDREAQIIITRAVDFGYDPVRAKSAIEGMIARRP